MWGEARAVRDCSEGGEGWRGVDSEVGSRLVQGARTVCVVDRCGGRGDEVRAW